MMRISQRKNSFVRLGLQAVLVSSILFACLACKKKPAPPPPPAPKAVAPKVAVQKPVSSVKVAPAQTVALEKKDPFRKDPFKPYVEAKVASPDELAKQQRALKPTIPLYSASIQDFKVIGIILDPKGNKALDKAMVKDPAGKGYVVKVGMKIGKNESQITGIDKAGVHVSVQYVDDNKIKRTTIETIPLLRKP